MDRTAVAKELVRMAKLLASVTPKFKSGDRIKVHHRGRWVDGVIVRSDPGISPHGWPYYVIDIGEYESIEVPVDGEVRAQN